MPDIIINDKILTFNKIIYVSPKGNDISGDGTKENPIKTIDKALTLLTSDEDCIYLLPGYHTNKVTDQTIDIQRNKTSFVGEGDKTILNINKYWQTQNEDKEIYFYRMHIIKNTLIAQGGYRADIKGYFYNCYINSKSGPFFSRGGDSNSPCSSYYYNSYLYNSVLLNAYGEQSEYHYFYNSIVELPEGIDVSAIITLDENSIQTSNLNYPLGFNFNQTLGIASGPYRWVWTNIYCLFEDNGVLKTFNTTTNQWEEISESIHHKIFLKKGLKTKDLKELIKENTISLSMTDNGILGSGKVFSTTLDFGQLKSINLIEVL